MERTIKIFLVEDDAALAGEIIQFLEKWGFLAEAAEQFDAIERETRRYRPHLILMDVNLPCYDGFYWCRRIRESSDVPVVFISSRSEDADQIMAIAQGGDDYVEKPFRLELLKAKIDAVLRRTYEYRVRERIALGRDGSFERETQSLFVRDVEVELTRSERKILAKLLEKRPHVVTREALMMELWGMDEFISDQALTTMISRLRNKLRECLGEDTIGTKKGQGYFIA